MQKFADFKMKKTIVYSIVVDLDFSVTFRATGIKAVMVTLYT